MKRKKKEAETQWKTYSREEKCSRPLLSGSLYNLQLASSFLLKPRLFLSKLPASSLQLASSGIPLLSVTSL